MYLEKWAYFFVFEFHIKLNVSDIFIFEELSHSHPLLY